MADYELRPIGQDEGHAFVRAMADAFNDDFPDDEVAHWASLNEPARTLAAYADGAIVATSGLLTMRLAVPGSVVPMAGVTAVSVHAVHRRRGLLDRMMTGHLHAMHESGAEAVSALWASEAGIYGRWGFGLATRSAELTIRSPEARLLAPAQGRPRAGTPQELVAGMRAVYDAVLPTWPGLIARDAGAWERAIADLEHRREGAGRLRALVADGPGGPAGYALFAVRKQDTAGRVDDVVELRELVAATPGAAAVLWEHLLGLALTRTIHWSGASDDDALAHMLTDARAVGTRLGDGAFVRVVDVPRALAQRTYAAPVDVVLDVDDAVCPWNRGRWRLAGDATGATCEPTGATPDLALTARELGAAYLGGTALGVLGAAGRIHEHSPGALTAASHAFKGPRAPWCFERF